MGVVEKEQSKCKKPFLGGWRHKINGREYLNAASQTGPASKKIQWSSLLSKEVQCVETKENSTQSVRHQASQMWRKDCCVSSEKDRYLSIKPYESYDQMQSRLDFEGHARIIQRYYRAYRIRMFIKESAKLYRKLLENEKFEEEESKAKLQKRFQEEIIRKTYPRSRLDFDMLYNLIDVWKLMQTNEIKNRYFKAAQCARQYTLLETTISMLNNIDKHRQKVRDDCKIKKQVKFLTIHCQPIRWKGYKGKSIEMVTLKTQKAREYKKIYDDLKNDDTTPEDRIEILLKLKNFLKKFDGYAVEELDYLVNQELIFLSRRIKGLTLDNLRNRILSAFLHFLRKCNMYTNDSLTHQDVEELREPLETETSWCNSCRKLLPRNKFYAHVGMRKLAQCKSCAWLTRKNIPHVNYDLYSFMLKEIRSEERRMNCFSSLAYVMQESDIYHLINHMWHGRSIVSENNDLYILRLIRFDVNAEWAPWNCILLTEDEAKTHYRIKKVESLYSKTLLQSVYLNHLAAKFHFKYTTQNFSQF